jgi:hypothetical protein
LAEKRCLRDYCGARDVGQLCSLARYCRPLWCGSCLRRASNAIEQLARNRNAQIAFCLCGEIDKTTLHKKPRKKFAEARTCFAMLAVMRLPTRGMTPGRSKGGSGIGRSRARRSIRPWRRTGLRISGRSEQDWRRRRPQNGLGHSDRGRSRRKR